MTSLDDKLLGEKLHYYCSSSSGESDDEDDGEKVTEAVPEKSTSSATEWNGFSRNTGPKGVIEDWQKYKQLEREQREETEKERSELFKKLTLTCKPDSELEDEESETFLLEYRKRRMQEMMSQFGNKTQSFGSVVDIRSPSDFLKMIDEEHENTRTRQSSCTSTPTIMPRPACTRINDILVILADQYKCVKFCKVLTTTAGLSLNFKISGVPALLVYKNKQIIGNFIRITDELGDEFCESDIENFLLENGILGDQITSPSVVKLQPDH